MEENQILKTIGNKSTQKRHNRATRGCNTSRKKVFFDPDELDLDWVEELSYFVAFNGYKVYKEELSNELFEYRIRDGSRLIVSVVSPRNLNRSAFSLRKKRRKRRRR